MLGFSEFNNNTILLEDNSLFFLSEGITHIEDAAVDDFIHAVENLASLIVSEKLDGSNLIFGFEKDGSFYTSREAKAGGRMYSEKDFKVRSADNGFRAAHVALEHVKPVLKKFVKSGRAVEVEVLFGRQPNAIVYSETNYLAFLRALPGDSLQTPDQSVIKELEAALKDHEVRIKTPMVTTTNGIDIVKQDIETNWKYTSVSYIDTKHFKDIDFKKELDGLRKYVQEKRHVGGLSYTVGQLIVLKLNEVKGLSREQKDELRHTREHELDILKKKFKLPIKEKLVDIILRRAKPALRDVQVEPHEDIGIEGVVILDPRTLKQLKIVDKDVFSIINHFNFAIRSEIKTVAERGLKFPGVTLGGEGSIFGNMLRRIGDILNVPSLKQHVTIVNFVRKHAGKNASETIKNIARALNVGEFPPVKSSILASIQDGMNAIENGLEKYKREWHTYTFKPKKSTGEEINKEIKYSKAVHDRTLMAFAETRKELHDMYSVAFKAKDINDIIVALYGDVIKKAAGVSET